MEGEIDLRDLLFVLHGAESIVDVLFLARGAVHAGRMGGGAGQGRTVEEGGGIGGGGVNWVEVVRRCGGGRVSEVGSRG
jgi:hypothetical protein